ncbi:MAG: hypothetical protein WDZ88_01800 [Candidatus Paceibacterota bacterium]
MALQGITLFLDRFKHIQPPEKYIKEAIIQVCKEEFNQTIPNEAIVVKKNSVYLKIHPLLRTELHIKKQEFEEKIQTLVSKKYSIY